MSTVTGTPWETMSKTAERCCARSTSRRIVSDGASPRTREADPDGLVAVPHLVGEPEGAAEVDVALDRGLDLGQPHAPCGRDVDQRGRQARGERVQDLLGRVRAGVGAEQDRRLAGVQHERLGARGVLPAAAGGSP
jgi:hypothetical protein